MTGILGKPARILALEEIDSTNAEAMRRAAAGERGPLLVTARRQIAGRGRNGRSWGTPEGNLAATLLFSPQCAPTDLPGLSLVAGIVAYETAAFALRDSGVGLRLKWPNDLLIGVAKLSGILIESTVFGVEPVAAIGIGMNVAVAPDVPGRPTTSIGAHVEAPPVADLARKLLAELGAWLDVWDRGAGLAAIRMTWLERAGPLGEPLTVNTGDGVLAGTFAGLDATGALLLETGGGVQVVTFGDVSLGGVR